MALQGRQHVGRGIFELRRPSTGGLDEIGCTRASSFLVRGGLFSSSPPRALHANASAANAMVPRVGVDAHYDCGPDRSDTDTERSQ